MMPFTPTRMRALSAKLNAKHVKTREQLGKTLSYLEGWHLINEANRIFGFDAWDRETLATDCVFRGNDGRDNGGAGHSCTYVARVRVRVKAGPTTIVREASGAGHGRAATLGEAHEAAIKEAETDAMKRALITFGNSFGLALYDKEQKAVRGRATPGSSGPEAPASLTVLGEAGERLASYDDAQAFCSAVRTALQEAETEKRLVAFWSRNAPTVDDLKRRAPHLRDRRGRHYADILRTLCVRRAMALARAHRPSSSSQGAEAALAEASAPGQAGLLLPYPTRVRDPGHRRFVSFQPCVICGSRPSQAHHVRYAEPRALGRKVSDTWVVPLCAGHHRELHDVGPERGWWERHGIDPLPLARELWNRSHRSVAHPADAPKPLDEPNIGAAHALSPGTPAKEVETADAIGA